LERSAFKEQWRFLMQSVTYPFIIIVVPFQCRKRNQLITNGEGINYASPVYLFFHGIVISCMAFWKMQSRYLTSNSRCINRSAKQGGLQFHVSYKLSRFCGSENVSAGRVFYDRNNHNFCSWERLMLWFYDKKSCVDAHFLLDKAVRKWGGFSLTHLNLRGNENAQGKATQTKVQSTV
jgi:hypothetical protein